MNIHKQKTKNTNFLHLEFPSNRLGVFTELLISGVYIETHLIGKSLYEFLKSELSLDDEFINNKINTIFLNNMPIDDLFSATIEHDAKIALSSSMPGLVGAILRKGSPYAMMREDITYKKVKQKNLKKGFIFLKLFNLLINEIGKKVMEKGIFLKTSILADYLMKKQILKYSSAILLNSRSTDPEEALKIINTTSPDDFIAFSVHFIPELSLKF